MMEWILALLGMFLCSVMLFGMRTGVARYWRGVLPWAAKSKAGHIRQEKGT